MCQAPSEPRGRGGSPGSWAGVNLVLTSSSLLRGGWTTCPQPASPWGQPWAHWSQPWHLRVLLGRPARMGISPHGHHPWPKDVPALGPTLLDIVDQGLQLRVGLSFLAQGIQDGVVLRGAGHVCLPQASLQQADLGLLLCHLQPLGKDSHAEPQLGASGPHHQVPTLAPRSPPQLSEIPSHIWIPI